MSFLLLKSLETTASRHLATSVGLSDTVKFSATFKMPWELVLGVPPLLVLSTIASVTGKDYMIILP